MAISMLLVLIIPFVFAALVLLLAKAPKVGVWVVAGLILAVVVGGATLFLAGSHQSDGPNVGGRVRFGVFPFMIIPLPFLFVLIVLLLTKAPKAGAGVIVAIVFMVLAGLFLFPLALRRRVSYRLPIRQQESRNREGLILPYEEVYRDSDQAFKAVARSSSLEPAPAASPIWSEGVEREFEADVYPSKLAAVRALGSRMGHLIKQAVGTDAVPRKISIFQESNERKLVSELSDSIQEGFSDATCFVEGELRNTSEGEVGVTLRLADLRLEPTPWGRAPGDAVGSGRMEATVFGRGGTMTFGRQFAEKPWVVDFAGFTNSQRGHYVVARSRQTCTSENDAQQQALQDASVLLTGMIGEMRRVGPLGSVMEVTGTDVLNGDLIVDQFIQSFAGSAGKIWRHALLIDASAQKLKWLVERKSRAAQSIRMTWARMVLSVMGVLVLIGAVYFFLNMATRGYYKWSLRIAGIILAIVGAVSVLMVIR